MADPVSNEQRAIATQSTKHVAKTDGPADDLHIPGDPTKKVTVDNEVATRLLKKGKTVRTKISNAPVWTEKGEVGPPSKGGTPPHTLSLNNGSQPFNMEATPQTKSKDVLAEGGKVVRTDDLTWQNRKNCEGYVDGSMLGEGFDNNLAFLKNKCTIVKIDGNEGARPLGFPRGATGSEPYYIEVLAGDTVILNAWRADVTVGSGGGLPAANPACQLHPGKHTHWLVERSAGSDETKEQIFSGVDTITLGSDWTGDMFSTDATMGTPGGAGAGQSLLAVVQLFRYWVSPVKINAGGFACAGIRRAEIKVFPANKVDFSIDLVAGGTGNVTKQGDYRIRNLITLLKKTKDVTEMAKKMAKVCGTRLTVNFLGQTGSGGTAMSGSRQVGASLAIEGQFLKCQAINNCRPEHVGFKWKLAVVLAPLLQVIWEKYVSLLLIAGGIFGKIAQKVLEWFNIGIYVVVTFSVEITCEVNFERDQHGVYGGSLSQFPIVLKFGLALAATGAKYEARAGVNIVGKCEIGLGPCKDGKHLLEVTLNGEVFPEFYCEVRKNGQVKKRLTKQMKEWGKNFGTMASWKRIPIA